MVDAPRLPSLEEAVDSLRKAGFVVTHRRQSALKQMWSSEEESAIRIAAAAACIHFQGAQARNHASVDLLDADSQAERLVQSVRLSAGNVLGPAQRREPEIRLISGSQFNVLLPHLSTVTIKDVIVGLSNQTRFAGQIDSNYTVGQHSVLASYRVPRQFAYDTLMHDSAEFTLLDMPKPIKEVLYDYQAIEESVEAFLRTRFGFAEKNILVKLADERMFATERRDVAPAPQDGDTPKQEPYPERIRVWSVRWTRLRFGARFHELRTGRRDYVILARLWAAIYLPRWIRPEWPDLEAH